MLYFSQITELDLSCRGLRELPDLRMYTNLKILHCSQNQLSELTNLPPTLQTLYCSENQLITLPNLIEMTPTLKYLWCGNNQITILTNLPPTLQILSCSNNQITELDNLFKPFCISNAERLTPVSLKTADFVGVLNDKRCKMTPTLQYLNCSNNQLILLTNLPPTLQYLSCSNNQITILPNLLEMTPTLRTLCCSNNQLTQLDDLPPTLQNLYCYENPFIYDFKPTIENMRKYNQERLMLSPIMK
jgi:Leucine-rich repeat (LRR) protein